MKYLKSVLTQKRKLFSTHCDVICEYILENYKVKYRTIELINELAEVRGEIDAIDAQLLDLLNRRACCAQKVGEIKAAHGEGGFIYRPEREARILRRIQGMNAGPLVLDPVMVIYSYTYIEEACQIFSRCGCEI